MATNIFLLVDSFALVFLVYALANFWSEWRRYKNRSRAVLPLSARKMGGRVAVIPSVYLYPGNSVLPFPARYRPINLPQDRQAKSAITIEMRKPIESTQKGGRCA